MIEIIPAVDFRRPGYLGGRADEAATCAICGNPLLLGQAFAVGPGPDGWWIIGDHPDLSPEVAYAACRGDWPP